jgi:hypothetical protein
MGSSLEYHVTSKLCGVYVRAFLLTGWSTGVWHFATQDAQILGTTADTAVAKSQATGALSGSSGSTGVNFSRQFHLSGAPEGMDCVP